MWTLRAETGLRLLTPYRSGHTGPDLQNTDLETQIWKQNLEPGSWTWTSGLLLQYHIGSVAR